MAGLSVQFGASIITETEENGKQSEEDANQQRVHSSERASSSSSSGRRPDGSSDAAGPADLKSLEQALRRESVVEAIEIGPLTVPSTPVRDGSVDGVGNDVRINLELASVKLSKLAPAVD